MIDRNRFPYLYWGWRVALPYNIIAWIFGLLLRLHFIPKELGEFGHALVFFFTPGMAPIIVFENNGFSSFFWLIIQLAAILFVTWVIVSPIFGMFRLIIGLKN